METNKEPSATTTKNKKSQRPLPQDPENIPELSERLRYLMLRSGMKQGELAHRLGIRQPHVSGIMSDKANPSRQLTSKMAEVLDCRDEWLAYGTGPIERESEPVVKATPELESLITEIRRTYQTITIAQERYEMIGSLYQGLSRTSSKKPDPQ